MKKTFLLKRLVIDSFDNKGNGTIEETLKLKYPHVLKSKDGTAEQLCAALRELFFKLTSTGKVELPEGTRMVHIKTNADKRRTVSCMVIFKGELVHDRNNERTAGYEGEIDWDFQ